MRRCAALILVLCVLLSGCFSRKATVEGLDELGKDEEANVVITPDSGTAEASASSAETELSSAPEESAGEFSAAESAAGSSSAEATEPVESATSESAQSSASEQASSASEASTASEWETADADGYAKDFGTLINDLRTSNGLSALEYVTDLEDPAFERLTEIEQSFSHTRPDGRNCYTVMDDYGLSYQAFGENLALNYSTAQDVFDAWMSSPGHYANMVRADFTGYYLISGSSGGSQYWVLLLVA